jgi:5'-nucleotidase
VTRSASPLILVTNDDGLLSPGLRAAAEAVADLGELLLVAPATQQTAMSRAFVRDADAGVIEQVDLHIADTSVAAYAVCGSPVMAVTHAVLELAERPIDLCISGINYGENIGSGIGVSGTIGAALEADLYGIPAIAAGIAAEVSEWRTFGEVDWDGAKHFTRLLAAQVLDEGMPTGVSVLNLNVPRGATSRTELRRTVQSHQPYYVRSKQAPRPLHLPYQFPIDIVVDAQRLEPGTDIHAVVQDGVVSVTPLTWCMTAETTWMPRLTSADGGGHGASGDPTDGDAPWT